MNAKTVKYADLLDNTKDIATYDINFAKVYFKEKEDLLNIMNDGNQNLYNLCKETLTKNSELY